MSLQTIRFIDNEATDTTIHNRRVSVSPTPSLPVVITSDMDPSKSAKEDLICDTGCTSACTINTAFCRKIGLPITPTNITDAKLGDGSTSLTIRGETIIKTKYLDNPIQIRAVVADEVEDILTGMPGLEQCGIDVC